MQIRRIAILGGGTAGWLAANHLGVELSGDPSYEITLIESPDVPIIGVGEGTVPQIRHTLKRFGISEAELVSECDVTFKQGIKFVNWMTSPQSESPHYYYHPFDSAYNNGENWAGYWLNSEKKQSYADFIGVQEKLCNDYKCPKLIASPPYDGALNYAYHLNAAKFAKLLAKNAQNRFGVKHRSATIASVHRNELGDISALVTNQEEILSFDFYVDCSGFHSILIEKELKIPLVDKSAQVINNAALAIQVPSEESLLPPYTIATAHESGWIWDIALTNRRGVGFVYSNNHMSESQAIDKFSAYLGCNAENFNPRRVPMRIGYREKLWANNCVALGLAQGFVEPLEATSILLTDYAAEHLAKRFPKNRDQMAIYAKRYNELFIYAWERVIDFIQLHYYLSDRRDSAFWLDNTEGAQLSEELKNRLAIWMTQVPERLDFFSKFEVFDSDNYLYILYGMNFKTEKFMPLADVVSMTGMISQQKKQQYLALSKSLPDHRDYLTKLQRAMQAQNR